MVGDQPNIPNHNLEFTDPEEAAQVFIRLTFALFEQQYKHVPQHHGVDNLLEFMQDNIDENVGAQVGDLKVVLSACSRCLNPCLN